MQPLKPIVYIVDDDPSVRDSLSMLLQSAGYAVQVFASANEFLTVVTDWQRPSCLVSDVKMPGISGLDLQDKLVGSSHPMPIIFITGHGDIPMSVKAVKKGAIEFLPKPFDDSALLAAVEEALAKGEQARDRLNEIGRIHLRLDRLTARERQILTYIIAGYLNKQIAFELDITEHTVKAHRKQVMEKMGVDSLAELVRLTEKAGVKPANVAS